MPIYEYACAACGQSFERLVRARRDERKLACPACGNQRVERRPSAIAAPRAGRRPAQAPGPCGQCPERDGSCPFQ